MVVVENDALFAARTPDPHSPADPVFICGDRIDALPEQMRRIHFGARAPDSALAPLLFQQDATELAASTSLPQPANPPRHGTLICGRCLVLIGQVSMLANRSLMFDGVKHSTSTMAGTCAF